MATWEDVERVASGLDRARPGTAHEGSPTYDVGRHPFARLRWDDDGREILQVWSTDPALPDVYADRRDTFLRIDVFKVKASLWVDLERLDEDELRELVTDSWRARRGGRG
jgi:hypothetical protein